MSQATAQLVDFDFDAFQIYAANNKTDFAKISRQIGFSDNYLSSRKTLGNIPAYVYKIICFEFGFNKGDFIKKTEEPQPQAQPVEEMATADMSEVIEKMEELITAINKLGNIQMQTMEYTKSMLDIIQDSNQQLKTLNGKYNKPRAYLKQ